MIVEAKAEPSSKFEVVIFQKDDGPLSKRISLGPDGEVISDGSACVMSHGRAARVILDGVQALADLLLEKMTTKRALALGALRADLPDVVDVTTRSKLNGSPRTNLIARTRDFLHFPDGKPAFALFDHDRKDMPPEVRTRASALMEGK